MHNDRKSRDGFTLTELSVLVAVGAILASVLVADLNQARTKLLQQACAANMKHWGMAFSMYADDYNGSIFYDVNGFHFTDIQSPLQPYFGTSSDPNTMVRTMRMCPARVGQVPFGMKAYEMPIGQYRKGLTYANADAIGSPYYRGSPPNYWPDLKSVPQPAKYLLLVECYNVLHCGQLLSRVTSPATSSGPIDPLPAIARHGGSVNLLFGDNHVELISSNKIGQLDGPCGGPSGNPSYNLN